METANLPAIVDQIRRTKVMTWEALSEIGHVHLGNFGKKGSPRKWLCTLEIGAGDAEIQIKAHASSFAALLPVMQDKVYTVFVKGEE